MNDTRLVKERFPRNGCYVGRFVDNGDFIIPVSGKGVDDVFLQTNFALDMIGQFLPADERLNKSHQIVRTIAVTRTLSLNSMSAEYRVFSQTMVTLPPSSMVNLPMRIPLQLAYGIVMT